MHHDHSLWLWVFFFAGQIVHLIKRAQQDVKSPLNRVSSLRDFVAVHYPEVVVRGFLASMLFVLWIEAEPGWLGDVARHFGVSLDFVIPLNKATSGIYGFCADSLLDGIVAKVPMLKRELPPDDPAPPVADAAAASK